MQTINLNLVPGKVRPVVHASQYDVGRTFRCNLFDGSLAYTLDAAAEVSIEGQKPDSCIFIYEVSHGATSYVDITTTEQMTAVSGITECELRIRLNGSDVGTANFLLEVEKASTENGTLSDSDISLLRQVENNTEAAATVAQGAANSAAASAADAEDSAAAAAISEEQAAAWAASATKKLTFWRDPIDNGLNWTYDPDLPE
jgi:hypothetical protein